MGKVFIYGLWDPRNGELRYVGKSENLVSRMRHHLGDKRRTHKTHWLGVLKMLGLRPVVEIIDETDLDSWEECEKYWISYFKSIGTRLTNCAEGGRGGRTGPGRPMSEEAKRKLSEGRMGHHWNRGWHHSDETRKRLSEMKLATSDQISKKMKGKSFLTDDGRRRLSEFRKNSSPLKSVTPQQWSELRNRDIAKMRCVTQGAVASYRFAHISRSLTEMPVAEASATDELDL